jgi:hypothetical protein
LRLAADAHTVFFLLQGKAFPYLVQLVSSLQCLLFQGQTFLFHLKGLLLIRDALLLPFIPLVVYLAQQVRIGQQQDGISLL